MSVHPRNRGRVGLLTDAEEGRERNPLPPPVRQPHQGTRKRGLPCRRQGDEAQELTRDQGFDRCAEGKEKRAEEDVAEDVTGGPEWVLLENVFGNGIVDLLERNRGRDVRPGEPISRVVSCQHRARIIEDTEGGRSPVGERPRRDRSTAERGGPARSVRVLTAPRTRARS